MSETAGPRSRTAAWVGLAAMIPPLLFAAAIWNGIGHGRPFMFAGLFGPESSHTAIGLVLVIGGMLICPLVASGAGLRLLRAGGSRPLGLGLAFAGLALLLINLATRQPYAAF